ncbi:hypothetical protein E1162_01320 [Rhodobacteraceae bacterium RKSG542]|uniref:YybH family protein n=1 Tax=Pseudovibrio flavus TaxID=2529854 RepID=UPI0012BD0D7C|nr:nuclear transport factor 2 family protein [Pseudovibrio flavus]MTI15873.1 hypothetical protein [Pseudovibrio flavus]
MSDATEDAVKAVLERFHDAVNEMLRGNPEPVSEVFEHSDDVVYVSPFGATFKGWNATYEDWRHQAETHIGGGIEAQSIDVMHSADMAIVMCSLYSVSQAEIGEPPSIQPFRTVSGLRPDAQGQWKIFMHHVDHFMQA